MAHQRLRSRPAHAPGPTYLAYTPDGTKLVTAGSNTTLRVFQHGTDAEPGNVDDCHDANLAIVATNEFIITGSEDGSVSKYSLKTKEFERLLVRCTLPVRDLSLSPDAEWVAVASDELAVKVVNVEDGQVIYLRDQAKPAKHVSWRGSTDPLLTVSCTDGSIYVYRIERWEEAALIKQIPALIKPLETDAEATSIALWHPDGRAFAVAMPTRDIQIVSCDDWERQRSFRNGHAGDVTAMAWSPNGAMLATTGLDRKLHLWDVKSQKVIVTYDDIRDSILALSWHPRENVLSYTNNNGELFIHTDFVPSQHLHLLKLDLQSAPFVHDPLSEVSGNAQRRPVNGLTNGKYGGLDDDVDPLDDLLGPESEDGDGFVVDDDGQGYADPTLINGNKKRANGHLEDIDTRIAKRRSMVEAWQPRIHPAFQPGSTPWRGNRRYLCLNLIGFVWTVDNFEDGDDNKNHTVTVEFYDREYYRDFHFTDHKFYDKACLNENGTVFACPPSEDGITPATIYYRPHEMWTMRTDWHIELSGSETVIAISLSDSYITVVTSTGYVRVYTLFGVPFKVYRQKCAPAVTCTSWRDYVLTIGNGTVGSNGRPQLVYSIENVKRDEVCQSEDIVALPDGEELKSVFFSDNGDPCIYDTTGTLLVLVHWRTPGQARWVPLLDTRQLERLADGKRDEKYWPVAVAMNKFHCIILKGTDTPYFPRPLLTEFDFQIPLKAGPRPSADDAEQSQQTFEEAFVRESVQLALLQDLTGSTRATSAQRQALATQERAVDKALLQMLGMECSMGEERGMKALEIVSLMKDRSGQMIGAAKKIAERKNLDVLLDKITALEEKRLVGLADDDD